VDITSVLHGCFLVVDVTCATIAWQQMSLHSVSFIARLFRYKI